MANKYVRSGAGGAGTGADWANAYTTLAAALTGSAAGDTLWVADDHAETQASAMTIASPGTLASPCRILCVNTHVTEPPTGLATTATVTVTGANNMSFSGSFYCYGITFTCGTSGTRSFLFPITQWWCLFEACQLGFGAGVATDSVINFGSNSGNAEVRLMLWINTKFFSNSVVLIAPIIVRTRFIWKDTESAVGGSVPTSLFKSVLTIPGITEVTGVDLSALGSGKNLVGITSGSSDLYTFVNCKLGASVAISTGTYIGPGATTIQLVNCDSADTNYRYHFQCYQGTITQETTIVRSGGATDGTTPFSRKLVSTANASLLSPLTMNAITFWNETVGSSVTVTVPVLTDNVTLTDAEAWIEVEYLGTSGFPLGTTRSDRVANVFATPANQTTDSSSNWTTTGLGTPVKQLLSVTFTPQEKGLIRARVCLGKPSTTMYCDPLILASSMRQYQSVAELPNEGVSAGGSGGVMRNPPLTGGMI